MRPLVSMDTIQIEITNACPLNCANCTRFGRHVKKPFMMSYEQFTQAVDSMVGYPKMVGMMGGEPLLHPDFEKMCKYLSQKIPPRQCGLWTCLPSGKEHYREVICETFDNIFVNDHTRDDIMHHPFLVSAREIIGLDEAVKWVLIDQCRFQCSWSASINPHGAFFCEMAASLSMLLSSKPDGWPVEPGWWWKTPKDYVGQMESYCMLCGGAMPLQKRVSTTCRDEISPDMVQRLSFSPKIAKGEYDVSNCMTCDDRTQEATYKDQKYRDIIGSRYGIYMMPNEDSFLKPYLSKSWKGGKKDGI